MCEMRVREFDDRGLLDAQLAAEVACTLRDAVAARGKASLVVSGGSTPKGFFAVLTQESLDWDKLTVTLADDRWVPPEHRDSNERLVREHLLVGAAKAARFLPLVTSDAHPGTAVEAVSEGLADLDTVDVVVLGMGGDGHFASLFPDSDALESGLDLRSGQTYVAVDPPAAPHPRMSMTLARILDTRRLFLHIVGGDKRAVLERAVAENEPRRLPISAVLASASPPVEVYWAP